MTSTPFGNLRLDSMTASPPKSERIEASASRMSLATYRRMFTHLLLKLCSIGARGRRPAGSIPAADARDHAQRLVVRNLAVREHRKIRDAVAREAREPRP